MDTRFLGLDNILGTLGIGNSDAFQLIYDEALAGRETVDLNINGCEWAPQQLSSSYEWLEAQGRIKAMATYVDEDSEPVARGKNVQLSKVSGTIPRQKRKIVRGEDDYRKELLALNQADAIARIQNSDPGMAVKEYLARNLFDVLSEIPDSHVASLSYARGQMFGARKLTLTERNNAGGLLDVTFSSEVPEKNVDTVKAYNVAANGDVTYVETVDPILSWKKKIRAIKSDRYHGYTNVTVEMTSTTFFTLMEHPLVLQRIGYGEGDLKILAPGTDAAKAAQSVGYERMLSNDDTFLKNWFKSSVGADELIVDTTVVGADKLNSETKRFDTEKLSAFPDGTVLIRPSGTVAQIFNVAPLRPDSSAISATIFGGRGIVEYWYDPRHRTQTWISELTVLPVPTRPNDMYYFECGDYTAVKALSAGSGSPVASVPTSSKK